VWLAHRDGSCASVVASDPEDDLEPSLSVARGIVVHTGVRSGTAHVVVTTLATGAERIVDTGSLRASAPALSPDGASIAFQGAIGVASPEVYVVPFSGGAPALVASSPGFDGKPAWAPDGRTVYFLSDRSGRGEIYAAAPDGSTLDPVLVTTPAVGGAVQGRPAVSPDGLAIAFPRASAGGETRVVVRTLATGAERVLADEDDDEPAWAATTTGPYIAVTRYGPTGTDIIVRDAATGAAVSTPAGPGLVGAPAFTR
jgi:TolB protein